MITCTIIIKEMSDGRVGIAMSPDQTGSTKNERCAATVIDTALQAAGELLLHGGDVMAEGVGIKAHVKQFVERHHG